MTICKGGVGCTKRASFYFNGLKPRYCASHKTGGMVDVVSKRCAFPRCRTRPSFNWEGRKRKFCSSHKSNGMVDVKNKRCAFPGCKKHPAYRAHRKATGKCHECVKVWEAKCKVVNSSIKYEA